MSVLLDENVVLTITLLKCTACTLLSTGFYGIIQDKVPHFSNAIFVIFQFTNPGSTVLQELIDA